MEKDSRKALNIALDLIYDYSEEQAEHVQEIESKVDRYEDELGTYLVKLNNKISQRETAIVYQLCCIVSEILNESQTMRSILWSQHRNFMRKSLLFQLRHEMSCRS